MGRAEKRALQRLAANHRKYLVVISQWGGSRPSEYRDYGIPSTRKTALTLEMAGLVTYVATGLYRINAKGLFYAG